MVSDDFMSQTPDPLNFNEYTTDPTNSINLTNPIDTTTISDDFKDPSTNLQSTSQVTGGFAQGNTLGNTPNMADFPDIQASSSTTFLFQSYVYFYFTTDHPSTISISQVKPVYKASMPRSSTFEDLIQHLHLQYPGLDW